MAPDLITLEQPLHYWVPSIAPCGMDFVTGEVYAPWKNSLLVGSLKYEYLHRCEIINGEVVNEELLLKNIGRLQPVGRRMVVSKLNLFFGII